MIQTQVNSIKRLCNLSRRDGKVFGSCCHWYRSWNSTVPNLQMLLCECCGSLAIRSGLRISDPEGNLYIHVLYTQFHLNLARFFQFTVGGRGAFCASQNHTCTASKALSKLCRVAPLDMPHNHPSSAPGSYRCFQDCGGDGGDLDLYTGLVSLTSIPSPPSVTSEADSSSVLLLWTASLPQHHYHHSSSVLLLCTASLPQHHY
jgi:hypothetical protein